MYSFIKNSMSRNKLSAKISVMHLKQYKMEYYLMNGQSVPKLDQKKIAEKIVYKNNKRKIRNTLIYLVGLHILFIFGFVTILCFEYLVPTDWGHSMYLGVISDICFFCYIVETLIAIKFKNRKMLISSIATLAISIGTKVGAFIIMLQSGKQIPSVLYVHIALLVVNCIIPWSLLLLWNKLKESKWRQTFDLYTKLNSHLSQEGETTPSNAQ